MAKEKKILIVDDSEIDRSILESILYNDFQVIEASSGFEAIENILERQLEYDAVMLDISMPLLNGFDVLRIFKEHAIDFPVFLITSEATKENVLKAAEFGITEFICKPFDREEILRRMHAQLGLTRNYWVTINDVEETKQYISRLERVYQLYLTNLDKPDTHYRNVSALVKIILLRLSAKNKAYRDLTPEKVEIISSAAYFCDIGQMLVPDRLSTFTRDPEKIRSVIQDHTRFGFEFIKLCNVKSCEFFIDVASEMCLSHHERYDGRGYPRNVSGKNFSIYGQICKIADEFDTLLSKLYGGNDLQINMVMKRMIQDDGSVSNEVLFALEDSKPSISNYYSKLHE